MKHLCSQTILLLILSILSLPCMAQEYVLPDGADFYYLTEPEIVEDGFNYYVLNADRCEVALMGLDAISICPRGYTRETMEFIAPFMQGESYTGDIEVPAKVMHEGIEYTVVRVACGAFVKCSNLTSVKLPSTIREFGIGCFYECPELTDISFDGSTPMTWDRESFQGCDKLTTIEARSPAPVDHDCIALMPFESSTLIVPAGCGELYRNVLPWKKFRNIVEADLTGIVELETGEQSVVSVEQGSVVACEGPTEIFDICGHRIAILEPGERLENLNRGIYIARSPSGVQKLIIR